MDALHEELAAKVTSAAAETMTKPGFVGALGGARVKVLKTGTHEVIFPLPQLVDGQVPVCFYIRSTPRDAAVEYRIQRRKKLNDIVSVKLKGDRNQEVQLEWSSVILIAANTVSPRDALPDSYRSATACVQADSADIRGLARKLWPENGKVEDYLRNIQRFVREMKHVKQPRSLDALGILDSGNNGICTANANLALALMRAKEIGSRSLAVIPPTGQRLEMHRIVEYSDGNQRHYFDPSSLHVDVPMKPWQTVIMAKTSVADEELAMKPRMGTMVGCPYAQELELLSAGVTLWGQDFFWTMAKPLTEFEPDDEAVSLAMDA
ncbi:MAG: hypothetical protein NTX48_16045 [Planctomycetales bacterium]|nr:hypothetical protein [Planctomycetales bacterium]